MSVLEAETTHRDESYLQLDSGCQNEEVSDFGELSPRWVGDMRDRK